ncbi:sensor histidine kinase [Streptomyces sp. NPDC056361]|uniref:sensor histidine kinase n=1 Tax=Streptomyces sp. NPDC056361 TaxID=3345795 RepID=UPI0035D7A2D6
MSALQALRPRPAPVALAVGFAVAGCLIGTFYHPEPWRAFDLWAYLLTLLIALPLGLREEWAFGVLVVTAAGFAGYLLLGYQPSLNFWCPAVACVFVTARERRGRVTCGVVLLAAVIALSGVRGRLPWPVTVVQALVVPAVACAFGLAQRRLGRRHAELRRLTLLLDEQQRQEARRAVLDERFRIARELHDTISQHMTIVTLQTGLAQYTFHSDPAAAHQALGVAATAGRQTLDELRRLLVVLRTYDPGDAARTGSAYGTGSGSPYTEGPGSTSAPEGPYAPTVPSIPTVSSVPTVPSDPSAPNPDDLLADIDRIPALAERLEATGLRVAVRFTGRRRPLPPGVELCAYRVVQEALTNVVKHSAAHAADVTVDYLDRELCVTVLDEGTPDPAQDPSPPAAPRRAADVRGSGHGLIGMRERAKIRHGSLIAAPRPGGGFQVCLRLPLEADAFPGKDVPPGRDRTSG